MPEFSHQVEVNVPIDVLWEFVRHMENWAPLVPGYIEHQIINEKESTWSFKSNMGMMKKKIDLKVEITSWQEPEKVTFQLVGINEKFTGNGYFSAKKLTEKKNLMTGFLAIHAGGFMAKVGNSKLAKSLPEMAVELTNAVAIKVESEYMAHK